MSIEIATLAAGLGTAAGLWIWSLFRRRPAEAQDAGWDRSTEQEEKAQTVPDILDDRRKKMSDVKVNEIPPTLLHNGQPVVEGDVLPLDGRDSGRRVKVIDPHPDHDGTILVSETFRVAPHTVDSELREASVVLEMTPEKARALMRFYQEMQRQGGDVRLGDSTRDFARPVFEASELDIYRQP